MFDLRAFDDDDVGFLGEPHGPDRGAPRPARTWVGTDGDAVIGAATALWSSRHPDYVSATIDVSPAHRRHGLASQLLHHLEDSADIDRPLLFVVERSRESTAFLDSTGFELAMTTMTGRVAVTEVLARLPDVDGEAAGSRGSSSADLTDEIVELYERIYRARHTWAGRYTPPDDAPWIGFAGPPLDVDGAAQRVDVDGQIAAVASLHSGPFAEGADAFLAPTSVLGGSFARRTQLLGTVLGRCMRSALAAGVTTVNVEVDSTYDDLAALVDGWPVANSTVREAWMRRSP